ncbi:MAG: hypothetical protein IJZ10_02450 [Thermoguttaceae bacterium]|nr:hypothetical protein [Thermoguttaceae bacterium]
MDNFDGINIEASRTGTYYNLSGEDGSLLEVARCYLIVGTDSKEIAELAGNDFLVRMFGSPPTYEGLVLANASLFPLKGVSAWILDVVFEGKK